MTIYVVEMNEWGCGLYGGAGNLLSFVSFCDKNMGVQVICGVGYSPENTILVLGIQESLKAAKTITELDKAPSQQIPPKTTEDLQGLGVLLEACRKIEES